jgi:hypothetical protein
MRIAGPPLRRLVDSLHLLSIHSTTVNREARDIPSSVNALRAEQRQLPGVGALTVADEIRVAVRASQFEVPVVGRQPGVKHFRDGDATISENHRAWRLLAAVTCITLDANPQQLPLSHRIIVRR